MKTRTLSIILALSLLLTMLPINVFAEEDYYAQYSGSTQASYGYKPNCTFTVNKIINGKFTGRFAASYSIPIKSIS